MTLSAKIGIVSIIVFMGSFLPTPDSGAFAIVSGALGVVLQYWVASGGWRFPEQSSE